MWNELKTIMHDTFNDYGTSTGNNDSEVPIFVWFACLSLMSYLPMLHEIYIKLKLDSKLYFLAKNSA